MSTQRRYFVFLPILFVIGILIKVYIPQSVIAQSDISLLEDVPKKIGVLPFSKAKYITPMKETLDMPLSTISFNPEQISAEADMIVTGIVHDELTKRPQIQVISLLDSIIAYDRIIKRDDNEPIRTLAQKVGEALFVDMMMVGCVWKYKRRVGSSGAVSSPASVGFSIYLIEVSTGKILWQGRFEETQQSLLDNILDAKAFFKKGAKWLTAEDLARFGVKEIFKKYPF